jgi:hypothetical protein
LAGVGGGLRHGVWIVRGCGRGCGCSSRVRARGVWAGCDGLDYGDCL